MPPTYFWGNVTASLNWCEEDYKDSPYIAEFWNTITNAVFVGLCVFGIRECIEKQLELRYLISYASVLLIGIGSWMFHMTLLYEYQLLDELPMIYATCIFVYCLVEDKRENRYGPLVPIILLIYAIGVTWIYLKLNNPVFHQVCYGFLVVVIVIKCRIVIQNPENAGFIGFFWNALFSYLFGFFLWNIDNIFCAQLIEIRHQVGPIISPLFQFHAWWHLLTAWGTYEYVVFSTCIRVKELKEREGEVRFLYGFFPYLHVGPLLKAH